MPVFPSTTAQQLWPFTLHIQDCGIDVERLLIKASLPLRLLLEPDMKLSTPLVYRFIDDASQHKQLLDLGWQSGLKEGAHALGPVSDKALGEKTLEEGINAIVKLTSLGASHADFFLVREQDHTLFCHVGGVSSSHAGYYHVETYLMAFMIRFVQQAAGALFSPPFVKLRTQLSNGVVFENINCVFEHAEYTAIAIPNDLMHLPLKYYESNTVKLQPDSMRLEACKTLYPTLNSLIDILTPYLVQQMPTIEQVAFMGSHNTRSLQRALSQHGVSYTDLVNKMKAEAAQHLLLQDNTSVAIVAQLLKYQHSSHFIRAFKKEIDMTPKQYQLNNEEHTK